MGHKWRHVDPFVPCFEHRARRFAQACLANTGPPIPNGQAVAFNALCASYRSSLFDKAGFSLYIAYRQSGLGYSAWVSRFETETGAGAAFDELFAEFPQLADEMAVQETKLALAWDLFVSRLMRDLPEVRRFFGVEKKDPLGTLELGMSDPHECHQAVIKLGFRSGITVFYKPRPLGVDAAWHARLGKHTGLKRLMTARTLEMGQYGYQSLIPSSSASAFSPKTAAAAGEVLALAWLLNANDLHSENVAFQSGYAGIFDLETILSPVLGIMPSGFAAWRETDVNATLMISTDVSGVSAHARASALSRLVNGATENEEAFFAFESDETVRPRTRGARPKLVRLVAERSATRAMIDAFMTAARDDGIRQVLREFVEDIGGERLRFVPRDTSEYYRMLLELNLPKYLRDPSLREAYFQARIGAADEFDTKDCRIESRPLVEDEFRQLVRGDIPIFRVRADSTELELSDGRKLDLFSVSPSKFSLGKIDRAEPADVQEQALLIAVSLGVPDLMPRLRSRRAAKSLTPSERLTMRLLDMASTFRDAPARWMSVGSGIPPAGSHAVFGDPSGFKGAMGIFRAMEAFVMVHRNSSLTVEVDAFLDRQSQVFKVIRQDGAAKVAPQIGLDGLSGDLLAVCHLMHLAPARWAGLAAYRAALVDTLRLSIPEATKHDVVSGLSGTILALDQIGRHRLFHDDTLIEATSEAGRRLSEMCRRAIADATDVDMAFGDIGLAHGASGVLAAAKVHGAGINVAGDILEVLKASYRRYGFWPDLRYKVPQRLNGSWCNGSVGVRRALELLDPAELDEISKPEVLFDPDALTALGARFCCGAAGTIDYWADTDPDKATGDVVLSTVDHHLGPNDQFDTAFERETSNLYYGTAGILYSLLRLKNSSFPSLSLF
tara:strand:- start:857 stop:3541 length:2685 start_codon:yes stop_codon:yes gene_type:complete